MDSQTSAPSSTPYFDIQSLPKVDICPEQLAYEYWNDPQLFFERHLDMPSRFRIAMAKFPELVCFTDPSDVDAVFKGDIGTFSLEKAMERVAPHQKIFGREIEFDGPGHLWMRRSVGPHVRGKALDALVPIMRNKTKEAMTGWKLGEQTSFLKLAQPIVFEIIMEAIFGVTDVGRRRKITEATMAFQGSMKGEFQTDFMKALADGGKWKGGYEYLEEAKSNFVRGIVEEIVERRANDDTDRNDILSSFMKLRDANGDPLSDELIAIWMRFFLIAGYDTTAMTMAWIIERVTRHPDVMQQIHTAVDDGDATYLDAVIYETMRLRPVIPYVPRKLSSAATVNEIHLAADTMLAPFIWGVHHRPDIYPDPTQFKPERFVDTPPDRSAWIPFGGGAHICLGMPFALLEMRVILQAIFEEFTFKVTDSEGERLQRRTITMAPVSNAQCIPVKR
jgi:cytochrome P450 family 135